MLRRPPRVRHRGGASCWLHLVSGARVYECRCRVGDSDPGINTENHAPPTLTSIVAAASAAPRGNTHDSAPWKRWRSLAGAKKVYKVSVGVVSAIASVVPLCPWWGAVSARTRVPLADIAGALRAHARRRAHFPAPSQREAVCILCDERYSSALCPGSTMYTRERERLVPSVPHFHALWVLPVRP